MSILSVIESYMETLDHYLPQEQWRCGWYGTRAEENRHRRMNSFAIPESRYHEQVLVVTFKRCSPVSAEMLLRLYP